MRTIGTLWTSCILAAVILSGPSALSQPAVPSSVPGVTQFIYTSDAHYGIKRARFRQVSSVDGHIVNAAMITKINTLSGLTLPSDGGLKAGQLVGPVDYLIETGDMANRQETGIQSDSASWAQFVADYIGGVTLKDQSNQAIKFLFLPGNHDVSNAIGYYKTMVPAIDPTSMVGIYNLMLNPVTPKTNATYNYSTDKIHYSRNIAGIHFIFVCLWPDSSERIWMANDLASVSASTPVILFTHDQPTCESKHFTNPFGTHNINSTDKFENMVAEQFKSGASINAPDTIEQRGLVAFLKAHKNITAYFHGNDNANEYYTYRGPDSSIALNTFRVDSPMKGNFSGTDETKLSFQLITIDSTSRTMTVRECLWNADSTNSNAPVVFGASKTVSYSPLSGVGERVETGVPSGMRLEQNYPNPFNPSTIIGYRVASSGLVKLAVYDVLGRLVSELVNEVKVPGAYSVRFDGSSLSSGIYFARMEQQINGNTFRTARAMTLSK
jgi:hypothetical protein